MNGVARLKRVSTPPGEPPDPSAADLNEVVAYNFRRAREFRGLTQDEAAARLERFLGQRLTQASISAIERAYDGERRREFDAHEILMFACAFDVPLTWFFLPPPDDRRRFRGTSDHVDELFSLLLGREDQLEALTDRFRELGIRDADEHDAVLERIYGHPVLGTVQDYRIRRKELLLSLIDRHGDELDRAAQELGGFFDRLRQLGIRGFLAANANDADFASPPELRGKVASTEQIRRAAEQLKDVAVRLGLGDLWVTIDGVLIVEINGDASADAVPRFTEEAAQLLDVEVVQVVPDDRPVRFRTYADRL